MSEDLRFNVTFEGCVINREYSRRDSSTRLISSIEFEKEYLYKSKINRKIYLTIQSTDSLLDTDTYIFQPSLRDSENSITLSLEDQLKVMGDIEVRYTTYKNSQNDEETIISVVYLETEDFNNLSKSINISDSFHVLLGKMKIREKIDELETSILKTQVFMVKSMSISNYGEIKSDESVED